MQPTVYLFDIDGTLLTGRGSGRRAMQAAFRRHFGGDAMIDFPFDGFTDRLIIHTALGRLGESGPAPTAELMETLLDLYIEQLAGEPVDSFSPHPGVVRALDRIAPLAGVALGLGTGNILRGARIKLGNVGLFDRFAFGGFGDDHIDRHRILAAGAKRGATRLGLPVGECRVVVVGDTPRDVQAAHEIGAEAIAVATGHFDVAALRTTGAKHVFADLACEGALPALLGS